jgi:hypothetical protein
MLSTIVFCAEETERSARRAPLEILARTLGSLVAANVEGLLGDVAIAGPAGLGLGVVADHAGCAMIEGVCEEDWLGLALEAARGPDLLLLRSGYAPEAGFIEEAGDFLADAGEGERMARLHAAPATFAERLFPNAAPVVGLIASREFCLRAPSGRFRTLVHCVRPAATLRTRARRVG